MLRICNIGNHLFDDGITPSSAEEIIELLREQVACKKCYEEFAKTAFDSIQNDMVKKASIFKDKQLDPFYRFVIGDIDWIDCVEKVAKNLEGRNEK